MGSLRKWDSGTLQLDLRYQGVRCREQTALPDMPANRKTLAWLMQKIEAENLLGSFVCSNYFPNSKLVSKFEKMTQHRLAVNTAGKEPKFVEFADIWLDEMAVSWRVPYQETMHVVVNNRLKSYFGNKLISSITKADIIQFRASLGKVRREDGQGLSAGYINRNIKVLFMILNETADRYQFTAPERLKPLKTPKSDVDPMMLEDIELFLHHVDAKFRDYYIVRFFSGMRTTEIDGQQWRYIDWDNRRILVRQTWVKNRGEYTKNDSSQCVINMTEPVYQALRRQLEQTGGNKYVFATRNDTPYGHRNLVQRVWYPALEAAGLRARTPYQTRHAKATLWLAAGEHPEWIARQMGHTTTEMQFRVYSRYVPNLTRQDGSAANRLLRGFNGGAQS